jgi:uncharacterized membrane protein YgdD (TMEM256/DUF423 family)
VRLFAVIGAIMGGLSVAAGAFGAHALKTRLSAEHLDIWKTAAQYQMYHAFALLACQRDTTATKAAGWVFVVGIALFSGSLYALALTGRRGLGAITPIGGVCFLAGWVLLAIGLLKT